MALSHRMAAPFFVVLLVIVVAAETAMARDVVDEKLCLIGEPNGFECGTQGDYYCNKLCCQEKFTGGECKWKGLLHKCFCKKVC